MSKKQGKGKAWLQAMARAVAQDLRTRSEGTRLRIRQQERIFAYDTNTDGWSAAIGKLGSGQPQPQIWFDRFSGYPERKLYAGFYSRYAGQIQSLVRHVSEQLWPVRKLTDVDLLLTDIYALKQRLDRYQFNAPVLERYNRQGYHFFGFYDRTRESESRMNPYFRERAVAFFLDVARSLPGTKEPDTPSEVYPRCESRKWVKSHLQRERSGYLAAQCKERDGYHCQVCRMAFAKVYGDALGASFAEAHHLKPLGNQRDKVRTEIQDLITVCANCHRMLHRMDGKLGDVKKLRTIVRARRAKQA